MADAAQPLPDAFEVTVGPDGKIDVPADELASHGIQPGARLTIVPNVEKSWKQISRENAQWQRQQGIEFTEEEAEELAVRATHETRRRIAEAAES